MPAAATTLPLAVPLTPEVAVRPIEGGGYWGELARFPGCPVQAEPLLDFPRVGGMPGRPKESPDEVSADRGDDSEPLKSLLRWLGIEPRDQAGGTAGRFGAVEHLA